MFLLYIRKAHAELYRHKIINRDSINEDKYNVTAEICNETKFVKSNKKKSDEMILFEKRVDKWEAKFNHFTCNLL